MMKAIPLRSFPVEFNVPDKGCHLESSGHREMKYDPSGNNNLTDEFLRGVLARENFRHTTGVLRYKKI